MEGAKTQRSSGRANHESRTTSSFFFNFYQVTLPQNIYVLTYKAFYRLQYTKFHNIKASFSTRRQTPH